jgi:hypothetical protein
LANRSPEQDLINIFVDALRVHEDSNLKVASIINANCKSRKYADVEFLSNSGHHWVIEAKSNDSDDAHNTVHKIFGELLKETGKENRDKCKFGLLIPGNAKEFYSRLFQEIRKDKYIGFGKLIPIENVFLCGSSGVTIVNWEGLYDSYES